MRVIVTFVLVGIISLSLNSCDQLKEPYKTPTRYSYLVLPQSTDDSIQTSTVHHYAFVDTRISQSGKLFVFLGGTGSSPQNYSSINKTATSLGYYVINLSYLNAVDGQACKSQGDPNCFLNYHEEMIFGGTQSSLVTIKKANAIHNRILKLLQRLHKLNPSNGWDQFYEDSELMYSKFVLAGHSQGGGHAAYLAQKFAVDRLVMFSSPNDYSDKEGQPASWLRNQFATSLDRFYGITHKRDEAFSITKQYSIWKDMKLLMESDTSSADNSNYGNFNAIVTNFEPNTATKTAPLYHNLTAQDYALPVGDDRKHLKQVWLYLLSNSAR